MTLSMAITPNERKITIYCIHWRQVGREISYLLMEHVTICRFQFVVLIYADGFTLCP